jgi:Rod binding domain-containing protein
MSGSIDIHTGGDRTPARNAPAASRRSAPLDARPGHAANGTRTVAEAHRQLRKACDQLEAAFTQQLFSAMRDTLPGDDLAEASTADDIFTGMLDEHVAGLSAERTEGGLSEALYRQLARRLPEEEPSE